MLQVVEEFLLSNLIDRSKGLVSDLCISLSMTLADWRHHWFLPFEQTYRSQRR